MMYKFALVLILCVYAGVSFATGNCTAVRNEAKALAMETSPFDASSLIHFDNHERTDRHLMWSGKRGKVAMMLFESVEETGIQISPVQNANGQNMEVYVTIPAGVGADEAEILTSKMTAFFNDDHDTSREHCVSANVDSFMKSRMESVLKDYTYDPKFPGWFGCFLCAATLGITVPIVMNVAIGEAFSVWCQNQGGSETDCDEASIYVVMALTPVIIIVGGLAVAEVRDMMLSFPTQTLTRLTANLSTGLLCREGLFSRRKALTPGVVRRHIQRA